MKKKIVHCNITGIFLCFLAKIHKIIFNYLFTCTGWPADEDSRVHLPQPHSQSQDVHWLRHLQAGGEYIYPNPTVRAKMFTDSCISKLGVSTSTPTPLSEPRCSLTPASPSWGWVHLTQPTIRAKIFTDSGISKLGVSTSNPTPPSELRCLLTPASPGWG
jgi:hypothetical protein